MEGTLHDRRHLAELEEVAASIMGQAGSLLLKSYREPPGLEFKGKRGTDPVTEVDRAVERLVHQELRAQFPKHGILGEEGTAEGVASEYLWVLDPLDGTANFAGRLPFFASSLALLQDGVPLVGCLFVPPGSHPTLGGVLRGSYGRGASVNGMELRLDERPFEPAGPVAVPPGFGWAFKLRDDFARKPGQFRNLGSICFELAMVIAGGLQYAAFVRPRIWDVAAGALLIREAGGLAVTWDQRSWQPLERFVAPAPGRDGKPRTLGDWARPVLVATPRTGDYVKTHLTVRPPPPVALRWVLARNRAVRRWWRGRRRSATGSSSAPPVAD